MLQILRRGKRVGVVRPGKPVLPLQATTSQDPVYKQSLPEALKGL
ncbi:hypothetical protein [Chitinophaga rhizophila]|nr:hypothetical protein [Chitinophaga rhizophila]